MPPSIDASTRAKVKQVVAEAQQLSNKDMKSRDIWYKYGPLHHKHRSEPNVFWALQKDGEKYGYYGSDTAILQTVHPARYDRDNVTACVQALQEAQIQANERNETQYAFFDPVKKEYVVFPSKSVQGLDLIAAVFPANT